MVQRSGIDTIKYHTWPRIPMGKWQTHRRHHKREPRGQPFPSRWPQSTYKQTCTKHSKHKTEQKHKRSTKVTCTYITWLSQPIEIWSITTRPRSHVLEDQKKILFCKQTGLYILHRKWRLVVRGHLEQLRMFIVTSKTNFMFFKQHRSC